MLDSNDACIDIKTTRIMAAMAACLDRSDVWLLVWKAMIMYACFCMVSNVLV
jgi:hypothetical protein